MWWDIKIKEKPKCNHSYKKRGMYFSDLKTRFSNDFDEIIIYEHSRCELCGLDKKERLYTEKFPPSMYRDNLEKSFLIEKLERKGIPSELEYNLSLWEKDKNAIGGSEN